VYGGFTLRDIARKLNEQSIPLPKAKTIGAWTIGQVHLIISQPAYIGVYYGLRHRDRTRFESVSELKAYADGARWIPIEGFPPILVDNEVTPNV
jgi:hypothetical protein